jgi:hypothetical protein
MEAVFILTADSFIIVHTTICWNNNAQYIVFVFIFNYLEEQFSLSGIKCYEILQKQRDHTACRSRCIKNNDVITSASVWRAFKQDIFEMPAAVSTPAKLLLVNLTKKVKEAYIFW